MTNEDTILVTGASGLIGAALVRLLKKRFSNILAPTHEELELCDACAVDAYFSKHKPAFIFHLAARVGGIHANSTYPADFIYQNTMMQSHVIEAARKYDVKKVLFPGSSCSYPKMAEQPIIEDALLTGPIEPTNLPYALAKLNGLIMAQSFARQHGLKIALPIMSGVYGRGDNFDPKASHVIPGLMQRMVNARDNKEPTFSIWGTGKALREFTYVDDVTDALLFLMEKTDTEEIINIGSGQETSIAELAQTLAKIVGYEGELVFDTTKPDGAPRKVLDSSKLRDLGWKPRYSLEEGLKLMFAAHFRGEANGS